MEYSYELKVPKARIAVLIGKNGEVKKGIEAETNTKIRIDSEEGDVFLKGSDAIGLYNANEVIKATARGFNPEISMLLLKGDYVFVIIDLGDYAKTKKSMLRLKGRVIGLDGKSRRLIEELSETHIVVYGKTVSIIGHSENVAIARKAIESLLTGSRHSNVYRWLEKKRKGLRMEMF